MEPEPTSTPGVRTPGARRRRWLAIVGLFAALLVFDLCRPPQKQLSAWALLTGIDLYQATLSKRMPSMGVQCRFTPTCSHYGEGAIRKYGALKGSWLAAWRVLRCGPWTPAGTYDPP